MVFALHTPCVQLLKHYTIFNALHQCQEFIGIVVTVEAKKHCITATVEAKLYMMVCCLTVLIMLIDSLYYQALWLDLKLSAVFTIVLLLRKQWKENTRT